MKKVLFILSGYPAIYNYLDSSILSALDEREDTLTEACSPTQPLDEIKKVCLSFQPDLVLTVLGDFLDKEKLEWITAQDFQLALWLTEDPYYTDKSVNLLPFFQYIFTINQASAEYYKTLGYPHVYYLPLGTNVNVFVPKPIVRTIDICLIGYPYEERIKYINLFLEKTNFRVLVVGNLWRKSLKNLHKSKRLTIIDRWIPPIRAGITYQSAKICLNTLRSSTEPANKNNLGIQIDSTNNRTFDIAATSSFQLTQHTKDLADHFELHKEITEFNNEEDLLNKLERYLTKDELREEIATNARSKVLTCHTFSHRLEVLFNIIFDKYGHWPHFLH